MHIVKSLYQLARFANDTRAITHPKRLARRVKNKVMGRTLARLGVWKWL